MEESKAISYGLWILFTRTRQLIHKIRKNELAKYGISTAEAAVLQTAVRLGKKTTLTELVKATYKETNTISAQLTRMEKSGLIKKIRDLERKNYVRIELTDAGYKQYIKSMNHNSLKYVMSALTEEEQLELWRLISKVREKAMKKLKLEEISLYPPSEPSEMYIPEKERLINK